MSTRTWLISVPLLATLAAVVAWGCGDDTTSGAPSDAASPDGAGDANMKPALEGGVMDAAKEAGADAADAAKEAMVCIDASVSIATFDSGDPVWACFQKNCNDGGSTLNACAADCTCNSAFVKALMCVADGGDQTTCFTPAVTSGMVGINWYSTCYAGFMKVCNPDGATSMGDASTASGGESGLDEGTGGDATSE